VVRGGGAPGGGGPGLAGVGLGHAGAKLAGRAADARACGIFEELVTSIGQGPSAYPLIFLIVLGDAVLPILPGETAIITGGILAARGDLMLVLVIAAASLGAFAGDNASYWIGRSAGRRASDRLFRGEKARRRLDWASRQLHERGATIIVVARFIPGGRTATTFVAGTLEMYWPRFALADAAGATLWSTYAALLGYFGGEAFEGSVWKPLLIALGTAALIGLAGEGWRRVRAG
jgi:membrane protein DedA with SNARE-associated domain